MNKTKLEVYNFCEENKDETFIICSIRNKSIYKKRRQ